MYYLVLGMKPRSQRQHKMILDSDEGEIHDYAVSEFLKRGIVLTARNLTVVPMLDMCPPDPLCASRIDGNAQEVSDDLLHALSDLGASWWYADTQKADYGTWAKQHFDGYRVIFWSHELDRNWVWETFKKHNLPVRDIKPVTETNPPGWMIWEMTVVRQFAVTTRKATQAELEASPVEQPSELLRPIETPTLTKKAQKERAKELSAHEERIDKALVARGLENRGFARDRKERSDKRKATIAENKRLEDQRKESLIIDSRTGRKAGK